MIKRRVLIALSLLMALLTPSIWQAAAQTTPVIGGSYYIAAQTWDGKKYVERLLYLSNNNIYQTTDITRAGRFDALTPANGSGIALRVGNKFLMRGGISSASWGTEIGTPVVTLSNPPEGSLTLFSTVTNYKYYIVAPNAGGVFDATNASNEASYQPKTSLYTPYFKFYKMDTPLVSISETLSDGSATTVGANYILTPTHGNPTGGNLWPVSEGTITIENASYNPLFYTFLGFRVGNSPDLQESVDISGITVNTSIKAVFSTNALQDEVFTFINAAPVWYANQRVYKAMYLDPQDNMLKWKTYDPEDLAFYFKAHGAFDNLTFESVAYPGMYITGATTPVTQTGNTVTLAPLGAGDYHIIANGQTFYAYNHNNGRNASGTLSASTGTSGSVAAWWIQSANDIAAEKARYEAALADEAQKVSDSERENARMTLLAAIKSVTVGDLMGNVPLDAYELAMATYNNTSLSVADYTNARTLLYSSCRVPGLGTRWRIINNASSNQVVCAGINDGLLHSKRKESLYQMWEVAAIHPDNPTQLAFRNLGSGTYMACNTTSSNSPTTMTDTPAYVNLNAITPGVFSIEVLGRADQYIYFATSPYGPAIIVNTSGAWRFEEVSAVELAQLSAAEDDRRATRQALLDLMNDVMTLSTIDGAMGYYTDLNPAVETARTVYNDATRLTSEYQDGIDALQSSIRNAQYVLPDSEGLYIICDHDGRIAMQHEASQATMTTYDDTDLDHFWQIALVPPTGDELLQWTQHYTLTSVEGENTVLNLTVTLLGNDEYLMSIDGDEAWNAANAQTPLSIHKASIGTHHGYLTDGEIYRIRNASTGKVLTRSEAWTARVAVDNIDNTCTDWNQLWRVEAQAGADRYQLHNIESNRHIEEQMRQGSQLVAAFTPGTWHLKPTGVDGQYQLLTTMAPVTQLAIGCNGDKAVAVVQESEGTSWIFEKVTPVEKTPVSLQVYKILNRYETERTEGVKDYLYTNNRWVSHTYANSLFGDDEIYQKWILIERDSIQADGTPALDADGAPIRLVALQSAYCTKYIMPSNSIGLSMYPYYFQLVEYTDPATGRTYTMFKDPKANQYLTPRTNQDQLIWYTKATDKYPHWTLEPIEGEYMNQEQIYARSESMGGYCKPEDGAVVRIISSNEYTCLDDYYKQNTLQHKDYNEKRYAQLWRLHQDPVTGLYQIENIYTGNYIVNSQAAGNTVTTTADITKAGKFAIAHNKNITSGRHYNILDANTGLALNAASTNINNAAPTTKDLLTVTEFRFKPGGGSEDDYAAMRRKYEENKNLLNNVDKYDAILASLFVDKSYTTLREDVTWGEIYEAIDELPEVLGDMVLKLKNDAWPTYKSGTNWDKMFRIREFPVVSSSGFSGVIKVSYNYSTMNEPTGILAHPGDVVAIMVEDAPKAGSTLRLEMIEGLNRSGTQVNLKQGLNLVQISEECNLFIYYMITSTADNPQYYLSNFPDIKIHIEGGEVYGCINRVHGPGKTVEEANTLWTRMQSDGLIKNGPMSQVVGESIILNFNSWDMLQGCPHHIGEVIDIWDSWMKIQEWIMGLRDHDGNVISDYIPNLKERWNNRWLAYERTGGFMNANGGGAQYNTSTIQGIVNFNSLKDGGGAWGPCHEHGHDNQTLINMCGMTEVSNNLFSNVCTREFGAIVSRGSSLPDAGSVFARGGNWFDNNIWTMTQMYYKLYLYYHVAGNKPTFYPEVFAKLRKNPLLHSAGVAVPADRDYLQFALACSEVAGEDLSEFFEAYGMLRPLTPEYSLSGASAFEDFKGVNCRIVGDYSTYHVYTTDEMIAQAKAAMAACGPKNGNIMFIDDRVRREPAAHPWAVPGQMRADRGDGGKVGAYGNVGMWDDFTADGQKVYAKDYTLTKESTSAGITLHVRGEGAVGYKIYGPQGELVYFSAFNDILLPSAILNKYDLADLVVAVAQADGTSVELSTDDEKLYEMTTYRNGAAEGITLPVAGRLQPELLGNDLCVIQPIATADASEYPHAATANVVVKQADDSYTAQQIKLDDKAGFYMPVDADCANISYTRLNAEGWNAVCLPFATTTDDYGSDSKIYNLTELSDVDGIATMTLTEKKKVAAGEPCFVLSADSEWSIQTSGMVKATEALQPVVTDDGLTVTGVMTETAVADGAMVLTGDEFVLTSDGDKVNPFRVYISAAERSLPISANILAQNGFDYLAGDANGDGLVSVTDITLVVNYILGKQNPTFVADAADANGDGSITVTDISWIVNNILNQNAQPAAARTVQRYDDSIADRSLYIAPMSILAGEHSVIEVMLDNADYDVTALQMSLRLPDGLSIDRDSEPRLTSRATASHLMAWQASDDAITAVAYSMDSASFADCSGAILTIPVIAATDFAGGCLTLCGIETTDTEGTPHRSAPVTVDVAGTSGLNMVNADSTVEYYSISGVRLTTPPASGTYIEVRDGVARKLR